MPRCSFSAIFLLCLALTASPIAAQSGTCILFPQYLSPHHTYFVWLNTDDNGECCDLCAEDKRCVAWTRDAADGTCALKDDVDLLVAAVGVDSGVKYEGDGIPELADNDVGASVIGDAVRPAPPSSNSVSAVAVATSNGGSSSASVEASPDGVDSRSHVTGSGSAFTAADTPTVSLATSLTKEHGEEPEYAVFYYEKPTIIGEVEIVTGKVVPLVTVEGSDPVCYNCNEFPCGFTPGLSFHASDFVLVDTQTEDAEGCCGLCRENEECVSWWSNPETGRCVLNSILPERTDSPSLYGGTML